MHLSFYSGKRGFVMSTLETKEGVNTTSSLHLVTHTIPVSVPLKKFLYKHLGKFEDIPLSENSLHLLDGDCVLTLFDLVSRSEDDLLGNSSFCSVKLPEDEVRKLKYWLKDRGLWLGLETVPTPCDVKADAKIGLYQEVLAETSDRGAASRKSKLSMKLAVPVTRLGLEKEVSTLMLNVGVETFYQLIYAEKNFEEKISEYKNIKTDTAKILRALYRGALKIRKTIDMNKIFRSYGLDEKDF